MRTVHLTMFYSQQLFLCSITFFFVNILAETQRLVLDQRAARIQKLKEDIGAWLRQTRESRDETLQNVADRIVGEKAAADRGVLSKLETGKANPTLDMFFQMLLYGYRVEFEQLCEHFVAEDAEKDREERAIRRLLEQVLRQGAPARRAIIGLLKDLMNPDA